MSAKFQYQWATELEKTQKENVGKVIKWYEKGLNDRYSIKELSKPQREYYKLILKNIFKDCKVDEVRDKLKEQIKKNFKGTQLPSIVLGTLIMIYIQKGFEKECGRIDLTINDLFTYFDKIKEAFPNESKSLLSLIKLNDVLNSGEYLNFVKILHAIEKTSKEKKLDFPKALFQELVVNLYKKYNKNFKADNIFDNEESFWNSYLEIISQYPFKKVNPSSPRVISDGVFASIRDYIKTMKTNDEKMNLIKYFLITMSNIDNNIWNLKLPIDQQLYDILDELKSDDGKRVFFTYKFRDDFNRLLNNGEELTDNELEAIDKCLIDNGQTFTTFVIYFNKNKDKTKKEIFKEGMEVIGCPPLEVKEPPTEAGPVAQVTNAAAKAVEEAAKKVLGTNSNIPFNSDDFYTKINPELKTFLQMNNLFIKGKTPEEIIQFIIDEGTPSLKRFAETEKDNKTFKVVIKLLLEIIEQKERQGCLITPEIIAGLLTTFAKQKPDCIIPTNKNKREVDTSIKIQAIETYKDIPVLLDDLSLHKVPSNEIVEGIIYSIYPDEFSKLTIPCREEISLIISKRISDCYEGEENFNLFKYLVKILKVNIILLKIDTKTNKYIEFKFTDSESKLEVIFLQDDNDLYVVTYTDSEKFSNSSGSFENKIKEANKGDLIQELEYTNDDEFTNEDGSVFTFNSSSNTNSEEGSTVVSEYNNANSEEGSTVVSEYNNASSKGSKGAPTKSIVRSEESEGKPGFGSSMFGRVLGFLALPLTGRVPYNDNFYYATNRESNSNESGEEEAKSENYKKGEQVNPSLRRRLRRKNSRELMIKPS
jgi:hypothetical protein